MTKNQSIAALVRADIMKRETTSGNQLSKRIVAILDEEYPEGSKELKLSKDGKPKKNGK